LKKEDNLIKKTYRYKFTGKDIKKRLGLKGNIIRDGLWEGQSPADEERRGLRPDEWIYYIETTESDDELERQ